jgi:spore coat polysaccharide biosynthesis protein SpsF
MITAIIQARMSSTRLPGKIMTHFSGNSLLGHIIERLTYSKFISNIVVATTLNPADDAVVEWLQQNDIRHFRGDEKDVLSRYYYAAMLYDARHIARITSDDPFKDPQIIDQVSKLYFDNMLDFAYNNKPATFAEGLDTEIFSFAAIKKAFDNAVDPFEREHVTQHFYRNPQLFRQQNLESPIDYSSFRWTIDTPEDMAMAQQVYKHLYKKGQIFLAGDILSLCEQYPEIPKINQAVARSTMYKKTK